MPFAEFKKTQIHFTDQGKGRVIVLLHGFLGSHKIWNTFSKKLSTKFRVLTVDLPGHGETPCIGYYHSMELLAQSVKAVLDSCGVRRYVIVGHSMGGYAALAFAELYPENVSGLCLFHSTSYSDSELKKKEREKVIRLVKKSHSHYVGEVISSLFAPDNLARLQKGVAAMKRIATAVSVQAIVNSLEGMKERKCRDLILKFASYPILFIIGKKDAAIDYETMYAQIGLCKHPDALIMDDVGHMGFLEATNKTYTKLEKFAQSSFVFNAKKEGM